MNPTEDQQRDIARAVGETAGAVSACWANLSAAGVFKSTEAAGYVEQGVARVLDVIADIGSYPDWVAEYKETEVLESDDEGYPKKARLVLDAAVLKDTMVLAYTWPADRASVRWSLVSSSLLRALDGAYLLTPKGSGTDVTYELSVDLVIPMIGLLKRKAERVVMDTALKELKKRVEGQWV